LLGFRRCFDSKGGREIFYGLSFSPAKKSRVFLGFSQGGTVSTMKEHLQDGWTRQAEHQISKAKHHTSLSKAHTDYAKAHQAMMDECDEDSPEFEFYKAGRDFHLEKAEHHAATATEHTDMAEFCVECRKALDKVQGGELSKSDLDRFDGIRPDFVSSIVPEIPQHLRAVPRAGQRSLDEMSKVDANFEELLKLE
jgi:hypothetical protein